MTGEPAAPASLSGCVARHGPPEHDSCRAEERLQARGHADHQPDGPADTQRQGAAQALTGCFAFNNPGWGFFLNESTSTSVTCAKCGAWGNALGDFEAGVVKTDAVTGLTVTPAKARGAKRTATGDLPALSSL